MQNPDHQFKIVLIGNNDVGKSKILLRFKREIFEEASTTTIGVEFSTKLITIGNKNISVQVWDTAGQDKFLSLTKAYYRGAIGALLVYDITNRKSFDNLEKWLNEIRECADTPNIIIMLVANKIDLEGNRQISKEDGIKFAELNKLGFIETSAKTGENIFCAFSKLVQGIYFIKTSSLYFSRNLTEYKSRQQIGKVY